MIGLIVSWKIPVTHRDRQTWHRVSDGSAGITTTLWVLWSLCLFELELNTLHMRRATIPTTIMQRGTHLATQFEVIPVRRAGTMRHTASHDKPFMFG